MALGSKETCKQQRRVYPKEYLEQLSGDDYKVMHSFLKEVSSFEHSGWIACFYYKHCCGCTGLSSSDCTAYCPFVWDGDAWVDQQCWSRGTSYQKWKNATEPEELAEYAEKIAGLRVANRSGVRYIV